MVPGAGGPGRARGAGAEMVMSALVPVPGIAGEGHVHCSDACHKSIVNSIINALDFANFFIFHIFCKFMKDNTFGLWSNY